MDPALPGDVTSPRKQNSRNAELRQEQEVGFDRNGEEHAAEVIQVGLSL